MKLALTAILLLGTTAFADSSKSQNTTHAKCIFSDMEKHANMLQAEFDLIDDEAVDVLTYQGHLYQFMIRHYTFRKQLLSQYIIIVKDATTKKPISVTTAQYHRDEPMVVHQDGLNNTLMCYPGK